MERLVQLLKDLEASDCELPCDHKDIEEITALLNEVFISKDGQINDYLFEDFGWYVYPVERDSFGWLIGAVVTKKGDIAFG